MSEVNTNHEGNNCIDDSTFLYAPVSQSAPPKNCMTGGRNIFHSPPPKKKYSNLRENAVKLGTESIWKYV